jgi:cell division protein ZapA
MAQVTVRINGYSYVVGCEDGQEGHLMAMAAQVDSRIESIKAIGSNSGEQRLLVLSALLLADELHDTKLELDAARQSGPAKPSRAKVDPEGARKISKLAAKAEQIANGLEEA